MTTPIDLTGSTPPTVSRPTVSASSSSVASISNPYTKKFVGGAQQARLKARKKASTRILRPGERERLNEVLSPKMNVFERFFAAMLRTSAAEYAKSGPDQANLVWTTLCRRVGLARPDAPLASLYEDAATHFSVRAALVLEEARDALAQGLARRYQTNRPPSGTMAPVIAHYVETNASNGHTKVSFRKPLPLTKEELYNLRPGGVFECQPRDGPRTASAGVLGVVLSGNREQVEKTQSFQLLFFRDVPDNIEGTDWVVAPIATLITEFRCFEAMTNQPTRIGFLHALLGQRPSKHIRFDQEENGKKKSSAAPAPSILDYFQPNKKATVSPPFTIPRLNQTQEKAATSFLQSATNTITLIQGPPGSGKTTLLVSVICRYLMEPSDKPRRLMVCAPTNKAVSVLASRFLDRINQDACDFTPVVVGDADKLLVDERASANRNQPYSENLRLRSIFLYSWMQVIIEDYRKIRNYFLPGNKGRGWTPETLYKTAARLERRLNNSFAGLPKQVLELTSKVAAALMQLSQGGAAHDIVDLTKKLEVELAAVPTDTVWRQLLANADIIFCTLASAGGLVFKNTTRIDDLIVDEAAAATEPEVCIPFHLQPKRLLVVGDPLQLPATVLSRKAIELGLAKSLQERLMFDCEAEHVMLDVQYRMRPEISSFPSSRFYQSKLGNGENVQSPAYQSNMPCLTLLNGRPYTYLQVAGVEEQGFGGSYRNPAEARVIVEMIVQLQSQAQGQRDAGRWFAADRIRVITFYQAQVQLLKRLLREKNLGDKIVVATVDSSQGCEADIVFVSFVRSQGKDLNNAGFLTDDRRMNVSLTRARYQLICVGNAKSMLSLNGSANETLKLLAEDAQERQAIHAYPFQPQDVNARLDLFYGEPQSKKLKYGN